MKKTLATRSISTLAVTGALVLGGAAAAQAGESSHDSSRSDHGKTEASAPISIGGLKLGTDNSSSSSDHNTSSRTGDHGDRSNQGASQDESKGSSFLDLRPITIDPSFGQEQQSSSTEHQTRTHDRGDDDTTRGDRDVTRQVERTAKSSTAAGAPSSFEGFSYSAKQHNSNASQSASDRDRTDGTSQRSGAEASQSDSSQEFDLGKFLLNPFVNSSSDQQDSTQQHVSH